MLPQIELFCLGLAAVIDSVLLLVVIDRVNRPLTAIWLKWALAGTTVWHVSSFFHALLRETQGSTALMVDGICMLCMAGGVLLLNCGILHAGFRLQQTGPVSHPPVDRRYLLAYSPLLFLVAVGAGILRSESRDFVVATTDYHVPYLVWVTAANLLAAALFVKNRHCFGGDGTSSRFLAKFAVGLVVVTVLTNVYVLTSTRTKFEPWLRLVAAMSPLLPTLIFAWYVFRRRVLPMVFERTLAYGGILLGVYFLHRLTISPVLQRYSDGLQFDFVIVEGLLLLGLVLAYHPLRDRVREGLHYLIGRNVRQVRDASRLIAVELSRRSHMDAPALSEWFVDVLNESFELRFTRLKMEHPYEQEFIAGIPVARTTPERADSAESLNTYEWSLTEAWIDRSRCSDVKLLSAMRDLDLIAIYPLRYHEVSGLLLLGTPISGDALFDEQLHAIAMLVDQFAATIHNRQIESARQIAERRAMQHEKLSVLGLLSGSMAHEIKNPLSSIRTIATLLREDLGCTDEHSHDVELIVSEIDRLHETTQQLLEFARPVTSSASAVCPDAVIVRLLHILKHLARQHDVDVQQNLNLPDIKAAVTDSGMNDILFNLIKNAIEAARESETRQVAISTQMVFPCASPGAEAADPDEPAVAEIRISDTGTGVALELQDRIFEPFVTGKSDGTGLGLYLVAQRVGEAGGTIACEHRAADDVADSGATFVVTLPISDKDEA